MEDCPCPDSHPVAIGSKFCVDFTGSAVPRLNTNNYLPLNLNDGLTTTSWKSPDNAAAAVLTLDLHGQYEIYSIAVNFLSNLPYSMVIEKSNGADFEPLQYFSVDCMAEFGLQPNAAPETATSAVCSSIDSPAAAPLSFELFSSTDRPELFEDENLLALSLAQKIRVRLIGFSGSGNSALPFPDPASYYMISELTVNGRIYCSGHSATAVQLYMPGEDSFAYRCACQHFTAGNTCNRCLPLYNNQPFAVGTFLTANPCTVCGCNNHAASCVYDDALDGGRCLNCNASTTGNTCEACGVGFFRPNGTSSSAFSPCQQCDCSAAGVQSNVCAAATAGSVNAGTCLCKDRVQGARCDQCQSGFTNLSAGNPSGCTACVCDSRGTQPSTVCDRATGQCVCKARVLGLRCDTCAEGYFALDENSTDGCSFCGCNPSGSVSAACSSDGSCTCRQPWTGTKCSSCLPSFYMAPYASECLPCDCDTTGSSSSVCAQDGSCTCQPGYSGQRCDQCASRFKLSTSKPKDNFITRTKCFTICITC